MGEDVMGSGSDAAGVSRRRFGRAVLLGGAAAGVAAVADAPGAGAAPVTDTWKLGGNAGVTEASNFLGTKDNHALVLRTNNAERLRIGPAGNVGIGIGPATNVTLTVTGKSGYQSAIQANNPHIGISGSGGVVGVFGAANPGSGTGAGVHGEGRGDRRGVFGISDLAEGLFAQSNRSTGVVGFSNQGNAQAAGVRGESNGPNSNGVIGIANNGPSCFAVWGRSSSGYAGSFSGKVQVVGTLSKGGGSFKIDHPLDPDGKYLSHSFVESPDMMNVYNGNVRTNGKGEATVTMPDWFEALNRDFRYQLTPVGQFAQVMVASKIAEGAFTIKTDKPNVEVSWQVTGIRQDAFANANRIPVEEDKDRAERGTRLYPEAFGLGAEVGVHSARAAAVDAQSAAYAAAGAIVTELMPS